MSFLVRTTLLILWSLPLMAATIWTENVFGDAGPLPDTAQMIWGNNDPLDAILGNLSNPNGADMFRILITDPSGFSAEGFPDPTSTDSQMNPQHSLFNLLVHAVL